MTITRTWLDAEPAIVERLRQKFAGTGVSVMLEVDAPDALPIPCVVVRYTGYRVLQSQPGGRQAKLRATWQALVVDRNGAEIDAAGPARARMSDMCAATLMAVMGMRIPGFPTAVELTEAPGAFVEAGLLFHPTAFSLDFVAISDAT